MRHAGWIEWHVASRPFPGERVSGDECLASPRPDGLLLAVIDGLGHGEAAAEVAARAREVLDLCPERRLDLLVARCHRALRGTRGAALTLVFVPQRGRLAWLGIGNVEAVVVRPPEEGCTIRESLMLLPGVVGYQMPGLRGSEVDFSEGDTLVLATDGLRSSFIEALTCRDAPDRLSRRLLEEYARPNDDALVLVAARVKGAA